MSAALISTPSKSRRIDSLDDFKGLAVRMRVEIIKMIGAAGSGHPGGSLSEVELLAALYFRVLRHDPANPAWPDRDRFILSKGHGCPALYVAMIEAGYLDAAVLPTLRKLREAVSNRRVTEAANQQKLQPASERPEPARRAAGAAPRA